MAVLNVTRNVVSEGGGVIAVRTLEGLQTAVLAHMRLHSTLLIGFVVAQGTL